MVRAWFMAENWSGDQREEHHKQPAHYVGLDDLYKLTLVEHFKVMCSTLVDVFFCPGR